MDTFEQSTRPGRLVLMTLSTRIYSESMLPGMKPAHFSDMLILAAALLAASTGGLVIAINLAKAPEGYEGQDGFHFVRKSRPHPRSSRSGREPVKNRFISLQLPRPTR